MIGKRKERPRAWNLVPGGGRRTMLAASGPHVEDNEAATTPG